LPASAMSNSSALADETGTPSAAISSSPGRMSSCRAALPAATLTTIGAPPTNAKFTGTDTNFLSRSACSFPGSRRTAGMTYECGSAAWIIPSIAAMNSSCASTESGWLMRIWLRT
jgi:hypothetical protein